MPNCKCCGEPVINGVVLHSECFDNIRMPPEDIQEKMRKLRHYEDLFDHRPVYRWNQIVNAEDDCRLLVLLCKVGDEAWFISCKQVMCGKVRNISIHSGGMQVSFDDKDGDLWCVSAKRVYATREDAEVALMKVPGGTR